EFDVIDLGKALGVDGLADQPGVFGQVLDVAHTQFLVVVFDQEEPIAAPGYIAGDRAYSGDLNLGRFGFAMAWNIGDRHLSIGVQTGRDYAHGRFNPMVAGADATQMSQGGDQANSAMSAHAEIADVVEEDDAGGAGLIHRSDQQGA